MHVIKDNSIYLLEFVFDLIGKPSSNVNSKKKGNINSYEKKNRTWQRIPLRKKGVEYIPKKKKKKKKPKKRVVFDCRPKQKERALIKILSKIKVT